MKTGTKSKRSALAALLSLALLTGCGQTAAAPQPSAATSVPRAEPSPAVYPERRGAQAEFDKEETVYAKADAAGTVRSVTVENVLNYPGVDGLVEDFTRLRQLKNIEGDEEFTLGRDGVVHWEDHGEKIRYEGRSDEALPVGVKLSYFLDGKPIRPEELAGKSGRLRMRFDYENHSAVRVDGLREGEESAHETCVPFLALSVVLLPEEVFRSVQATEGKLLSLGDQSIFLGYGFPGLDEALQLADYRLTEELELPAYAELEAEVENFSLDFTATIFSNSLLRELEPEDLDELDDFADTTADFLDALRKLSDGANALADGSRSLNTALGDYTGGVDSLARGARVLSGALAEVDGELGSAKSGLDALLALLSGTSLPSLDSVAEALDLLIAYLEQLQTQLQSLQGYPARVGEAVAQAQSSLAGVHDEAAAVLAGSSLSAEEQAELLQRIDASVGAAQSAVAAAGEVPGGADFSASLAGLCDAAEALRTQAEALRASPEQIRQLDALLAGLREMLAAFEELSASAGRLSDGAAGLSQGGGALRKAIAALVDGAGALSDGVGEFRREGSEELDELGGAKLRALVTRLRALRQADLDYDSFSGVAPGRSSSVRFIIETDAIE